MNSNVKPSAAKRRRWLAGVATALTLTTAGIAAAPPASATAMNMKYVGGFTVDVPYRGVTVPVRIPAGTFTFIVDGDNYHVNGVYGSYLSSGISSWQLVVTFVDDQNRTIDTFTDTHKEHHAVGAAYAEIYFGSQIPKETNLVCGKMMVRGVEVSSTCHKVYDGWRFW